MSVECKFVQIKPRVPGVLYLPPEADARNRIGILVMHSDENYLSFPTGKELAERGYTVLCADVQVKEGIFFSQIEKMDDVGAALEVLRSLPGIEKTVLMGHSGGGTLMTAYQSLAENGPEVFRTEQMLYPYPEIQKEYLPADGLMLFDSNWGNAVMQLFSLDPAVSEDENGMKIDPELDLFNPENGFSPEGSRYCDAFIRRFQEEQGKRNVRLIRKAEERLQKIRSGCGNFEDDEPFVIAGAAQGFRNNKLFAQDIRLMSHTKKPHTLLHPDGSRTFEIVKSVRHAENPESLTANLREGARIMTVRNFLSSYAIRTSDDYGFGEDEVSGIDWASCYASPVGNVEKIRVPFLAVGMTGGWEYLASETIYDHSGSGDKTIAFVEGATHKFTPAVQCESYPGEFGDTMKTLHDFADSWLSEPGRF